MCLVQYQRKESLQFIPGRMHQQDAVLDQAGTWLVQCRTTNHFDAGMDALLNVMAAPREPAALCNCRHSNMDCASYEGIPQDKCKQLVCRCCRSPSVPGRLRQAHLLQRLQCKLDAHPSQLEAMARPHSEGPRIHEVR